MNQHTVYLTRNGRISIAGLTSKNVEWVANGIILENTKMKMNIKHWINFLPNHGHQKWN